MSGIWTPEGAQRPDQAAGDEAPGEPSDADLAALRTQLAQTPAAVVVTNHCFGLWELAALHLSLQPPQLGEATVAIDALGAVVERLEGRLGDDEGTLRDALAQLRLAFVQIQAAAARPDAAGGSQAAAGGGGPDDAGDREPGDG